MISLAGLTLAAAAICGAYLLAFLPDPLPRAAPWLLWGGLCLVLPSFLGLALEGSKGRAARVAVVLLLFAVPAAGLGGALLLPVEDPDSPLILGLPARAALLLYGVGLVPGLVLSLAYAVTFGVLGLDPGRLAELRRQLRDGAKPR